MKFHAVTVVVLLVGALPSYAQTAAGRPVGRVDITVGGGLLGGAELGSADANLRANDPARQSFRLFTTDSRFARVQVFHLHTGFAFNQRLALEGGLTWSRPNIQTSTRSDMEGAPPITMAEQVDQYFVDGSLLIMLDELRVGARMVPFVAAGGGYLRQLHEGQTVVEHGQVYHVGGGIKYRLLTRDSGVVRAVGLRGDARAYLMRGGVAFEDGPRPHVAVSGAVFVGF